MKILHFDKYGRIKLAVDALLNALQSVATDRLQVRGEDQVFSLKDKLSIRVDFVSTGADPEILNTGVVTAGEWWIVTHASMLNGSGAGTVSYIASIWGVTTHELIHRPTMVQDTSLDWNGLIVLAEDDLMRARFGGTAVGNVLSFHVDGYRMTVEV